MVGEVFSWVAARWVPPFFYKYGVELTCPFSQKEILEMECDLLESPPSPNVNTASLFTPIIRAPETEHKPLRGHAIQTDRTLESPPAHFSAPPLTNTTSWPCSFVSGAGPPF